MKTLNYAKFSALVLVAGLTFSSCSDDNTEDYELPDLGQLGEDEDVFGKATGNFTADEWYPGGQAGTTTKRSYSTEVPQVEASSTMDADFQAGIDFFERIYTFNEEPRKGLGPAWVRNSCIKCHPSYGHGKRVDTYTANTTDGNGYLLVVYHPVHATTSDGVEYTTEKSSYISEVTGMPQTKAQSPFKAPIEENGIHLSWETVTSMPSGLAPYSNGHFQFPDGETFDLIYPEINIDVTAFNTDPLPTDYEVRLESTIGLYGTGLLDAIDQDDMLKQYQAEAPYVAMNPGIWDKENNTWASSAWYTLADGTKMVKKFTYAMTRASLQDGPGANAIWNITNVTRSDRKYLYTSAPWAKKMSEDDEVISTIAKDGKDATSLLHPYYVADANGNADKTAIAERINTLLSMNTAAKGGDNYTAAFGDPEMTDKQYYQFMVWHRGLAVPAARDLDNEDVQLGKKLFTEIGCAQCHRPSWTTGDDNYWVDNSIKAYCAANGVDASTCLPKYAHQTIYPYTDLVQHRLFMKNDIRTGWCRTTPLWGRGLSLSLTGAQDRLHDCRARNEIEAIMWHAYSKDSQAYASTQKFYNLSKSERNAIVAFLKAI